MDFLELATAKAQQNLIPFCVAYDVNYTVNWHHRAIAQALEKVESGEIKRLILEVPPRHGKSQLATIYFPAWFLGRNPDREIITVSYSADLASDFGAQARDVIADPQYQAIFPTRLKPDTKSKNNWETMQGGSYVAVGVGGALTGRGANVLIIDDPIKNREEAESKVIRDNIWNFYTSTAYTRLEKNGAIIIIMTRWHTDDLVGRLLERSKESGDKWHVVRFPAIAEAQEPHRAPGEALWPDKYTTEMLAQTREVLGVYDFNSLYQQAPISAETQEFKQEHFRYFEERDIQSKPLDVYITIDLAISQKDHADNSAICVVGKERGQPELYILEEISGRFDPLQIIDQLFLLKAKYGARLVRVGIESVAYQKALSYFLKEEMRKRGVFFDIVDLKATIGSKEQRIRGLIPLYKNGLVFHRPSYKNLEEELLTFPQGKHDDRIDALAYVPHVLTNTVFGGGPKQIIPRWRGYHRV